MSCRTARICDARAWPAVAVDTAARDRIEALEREVTTLRAQLATERDLADELRERAWQLEDELGGYQVALAEVTVDRDRQRRDAEQLAAEYADAIATGARLEDEVERWREAAHHWMRAVGQLQAEIETLVRRERTDAEAQTRAPRARPEEVTR